MPDAPAWPSARACIWSGRSASPSTTGALAAPGSTTGHGWISPCGATGTGSRPTVLCATRRGLPAVEVNAYFACISGEAERDLWHADLDAHLPVVLLFGSETEGLPGPLRAEHGDRLVRLPMRPGSVRALNLSTAVAVAGYEVERRRRRGRHG